MTKQEAINKAGTAKALASLLGISKSAVSHWGEEIPPMRLYQLKAMKPRWFRKPSFKVAA